MQERRSTDGRRVYPVRIYMINICFLVIFLSVLGADRFYPFSLSQFCYLNSRVCFYQAQRPHRKCFVRAICFSCDFEKSAHFMFCSVFVFESAQSLSACSRFHAYNHGTPTSYHNRHSRQKYVLQTCSTLRHLLSHDPYNFVSLWWFYYLPVESCTT